MQLHIPSAIPVLWSRITNIHARVATALALDTQPWRHWAVVYCLLLPFFTIYRCAGLSAMLDVFAAQSERTTGTTIAVLVLGVCEDFVLVTLLLSLLSACDFALGPRRNPAPLRDHDSLEDKPSAPASRRGSSAAPAPALAAAESSRVAEDACVSTTTSTAPAPIVQEEEQDEEDDEPIIPLHIRRAVVINTRRLLRMSVHAWLLTLALLPFAVDVLLLRTRGLRMPFAFANMYVHMRNPLAGVEISHHDVQLSTRTSSITFGVVALVVIVAMCWLDFSRWHLAKLVPWGFRRRHCDRRSLAAAMAASVPRDAAGVAATASCHDERSKDAVTSATDYYVSLEDGDHHLHHRVVSSTNGDLIGDGYILAHDETSHHSHRSHSIQQLHSTPSSPPPTTGTRSMPRLKKIQWKRAARALLTHLIVFFILITALLITTHHFVPAVVSAAALNSSLNELLRLPFRIEFLKSLGDGTIDAAATYIHTETESCELFRDDVLFRRTTGFKGPLAFDVAVNKSDPPNVLVLVVESFRFKDSLYLRGNTTTSPNVSLTPNFDRYAKRGVAFRNVWSSWQTSRSVESILFGQVPYDHNTKAGGALSPRATATKAKVKLHGLPQLLKAKGYENTFTSGVRLKFDQWSQFMLQHGFDYVMGSTAFKAYAEKDYNISAKDWKSVHDGGAGRAGYWGVHDDVSFDVLGDLMVNKTLEQQAHVRLGEPKTPFFINHYTVSSHSPFAEYPEWFKTQELPDFSPLYKGNEDHAAEIEAYARLRYFEDLALGKFLDKLQQSGVLNETVVVIIGDHGQSPERGFVHPEQDEIATTRVAAALLAEGRLGVHSGLVVDDAAEQYDLLNTLADIVGVPDGGFLQSGVGRSLKRAVPLGSQRAVWTNNPVRHFGVVQGTQRLSYDRVFSEMHVFDTEKDPQQTTDLLPALDNQQKQAWERLREQGRRLSRYFRVRWDRKCISQVDC